MNRQVWIEITSDRPGRSEEIGFCNHNQALACFDNFSRSDRAVCPTLAELDAEGEGAEPFDHDHLDFDIYNKGKKIAVLEVKGRNRNLAEAYDLPLAERKFNKMMSEDVKKIILWDCLDGMIYGDLEKLSCTSRIGGRKAREGSANDIEHMKYFFRQDNLLEFKY